MSKEGEVGPVPDLWLRQRGLREKREAGDRSQLARRVESANEALADLCLSPIGIPPHGMAIDLVLREKKKTLLALRSEANAEDTSRVAQIRTAIDRLGALWAVIE